MDICYDAVTALT